MTTARCQFNAFDRESSDSLSRIIEATSLEDFKAQERKFDLDVPFRRGYFDHEILECENEALRDAISDYLMA
jgi:hypothetical protein